MRRSDEEEMGGGGKRREGDTEDTNEKDDRSGRREWIEFRKSHSNFLATCVREKGKESWLVKATLLFLVDPDKFR